MPVFGRQNSGDSPSETLIECMSKKPSRYLPHESVPSIPLTLLGCEDVILHDRDAPSKAMFITQTFKYPLRRVSLLFGKQFVRFKNLIDDPGKTIQLRATDRFVAPITRWDRKPQHLFNSATVDPENTRRFPTAHAINKNSVTNAPIQIHVLQSRPPSKRRA
jgi:hypothetical protein